MKRFILGLASRRGIETHVAGFRSLIPELQAELGAQPLFNFYTYRVAKGDPIVGWLNVFIFALGGGLAGLAGALIGPITSVPSTISFTSGLSALILVIGVARSSAPTTSGSAADPG